MGLFQQALQSKVFLEVGGICGCFVVIYGVWLLSLGCGCSLLKGGWGLCSLDEQQCQQLIAGDSMVQTLP